jgi:hypothetical protein
VTDAASDAEFPLTVLNSTPVIDGVPTDGFADTARARAWLASATQALPAAPEHAGRAGPQPWGIRGIPSGITNRSAKCSDE